MVHAKTQSRKGEVAGWLLALAVLIAGGSGAGAQIRFVPGPQRSLSFAPQFIAAADFNNDQIEDVAVTSSIGTTVTVLLGAPDVPAFSPMLSFNIGRTLRGLQAGDLNNDGIPDIAVADFIDNKVFTASGIGDGTFNTPVPYKGGLSPFDIAIGNFDGRNGSDLLICSQDPSGIGIYLNQGLDRGFSSLSLRVRSRIGMPWVSGCSTSWRRRTGCPTPTPDSAGTAALPDCPTRVVESSSRRAGGSTRPASRRPDA